MLYQFQSSILISIALALVIQEPIVVQSVKVIRQASCPEQCRKSFQEAKAECIPLCNLRRCDSVQGKKNKGGTTCTADDSGDELIPNCTMTTQTKRNGIKFICKCKTRFVKKVTYFPRAKGNDLNEVRNCFKRCIVNNQFGTSCGAGELTKKIMADRAKECCEPDCNGKFTKNKICRRKTE